jgi:hypothetical protein
MMSGSLSAASRRAVIGLGLAAVLGVATLSAQQTAAPAAAAPPAQADAFKFTTDGAAVLWLIKADKAADFESVMGVIKSKMVGSDKPDIKAAGESMKYFKIDAPASAEGLTYIVFIEVASKTTSYSPTEILFNMGLFERADADMVYAKLQGALNKVIPWPLIKVG